MKLFEFEGKKLFRGVGIETPKGVVVAKVKELEAFQLTFPVVVKAQVLSGKRGKRGLVKKITDSQLISQSVNQLIGKEVDGEKIEKVLIEEAVDIQKEVFVSITYSTKTRGPVLLISQNGGVEVESLIDITEIPLQISNDQLLISKQFSNFQRPVSKILEKVVNDLWRLFREKDLFLAEINPLAITKDGKVVALDAKVVTDDAAGFRQQWELPERSMLGRAKTWAEIESEKIDKKDHQGVVGRVYLDLAGDIGVIAAGGGASLVAMDALVGYGLKPANYTEFSGNPPKWKVKRLTEIVLAKKNLKGAILVGGKANFTDQMETLSGFLEALMEINPRYPIVVRRDGPGMQEAKEMLEQAGRKNKWRLLVLDAQTPIVDAVRKLVELIR